MAFTSNWEWVSLTESYNTSISGGVYDVKRPITLQRFRYSDAAYSSEKGTQSSSLSGYNGGVTETKTAPSFANIGRFGTTRNWVLNTSNWIQAGGLNGQPVYTQLSESIPDGGLVNTIFAARIYNSVLTYLGACWWCCAIPPSDFGLLPTWFEEGIRTGSVGPGAKYYVPEGKPFGPIAILNGAKTSHSSSSSYGSVQSSFSPTYFDNDTSATWSGSSSFSIATRTINFECISDVQSYPQRHVDWYKQTQTWRTLPIDS